MNATKFPLAELVPHDTVVKELVSDTVDYGAELGVGGERFSAGSFSQALFVSIKVSWFCRACVPTTTVASSSPRPIPAFQCCTRKAFSACNIATLKSWEWPRDDAITAVPLAMPATLVSGK